MRRPQPVTPVTCPGPHACSQASFVCKVRINIALYTSSLRVVFMAGVVLQASADDTFDVSWTIRPVTFQRYLHTASLATAAVASIPLQPPTH